MISASYWDLFSFGLPRDAQTLETSGRMAPKKNRKAVALRSAEMKAARSPHFEAGGKRRRVSARRQRRAVRRTRRSVSIASPQAGGGTERDRPEALRMRRPRRATSGVA